MTASTRARRAAIVCLSGLAVFTVNARAIHAMCVSPDGPAANGRNVVAMGHVVATDPAGELGVEDCNEDDVLDLIIPESAPGDPERSLSLGDACPADGVHRVRILFASSNPSVWRAYDENGTVLDTASRPSGGPQFFFLETFSSAIDRVQVVGREICVMETCVRCEPDSPPLPPGGGFIRSDSNDDGQTDLADSVFLLQYLFTGGT